MVFILGKCFVVGRVVISFFGILFGVSVMAFFRGDLIGDLLGLLGFGRIFVIVRLIFFDDVLMVLILILGIVGGELVVIEGEFLLLLLL